ncbi:condensation domain-containing protein, partial [Kitasatospora sp. NPDC059577]|uniref:condensation domain-containing protein n=1 Tax=Kitasatospora sp. NPDC059577 TaxID=3346873 RepID=UPI003684EE03
MQPSFLDILPLAPLQEGLLFHAMYDEQASDVYVVQLALELQGELDARRLQAAARALLHRHPNLSARFLTRATGRPLQVIPAEVELPWTQADFAAGSETVAKFLAEERARRFDLAKPPLLRFALIRHAPEHHTLALTIHHILLDGWSVPTLIRELFTLYSADEEALAPAAPYRDYLAWLADRDQEAARTAWRTALDGLDEPCRLSSGELDRPRDVPHQISRHLSADLTRRLHQHARSHGLTPNTLIQGAWGLLLAALTGRDDVVFGTTVSGRPPEIPGITTMVGLFINTVPVRIRLDFAETLTRFLARIQREQAELLDHQHLSLADIQQTAGHTELFDTTTVFENYPLDFADFAEFSGGLRLTGLGTHGDGVTHYPLCLSVVPGERMRLRLAYRTDLFNEDAVEAIAGRLVGLLETIVSDPERRISRIDVRTEAERVPAAVRNTAPDDPSVSNCIPD